jgi:F-type H+-transporting ATPase subunit delta
MSNIRIAVRYAKSLISLAQENNGLDSLKKDMDLVDATCEGSRELRVFLANPVITKDQKLKVLQQLFSKHVSPLTIALFQMLCRKGRESVLHNIAKEVVQQYYLINGIQEALVKTAAPLDSKQKEALEKQVTLISSGKKPILKEKVAPELIGGFILQVGDRQIDESVSTKLNKLKLQFRHT